MSDAFELRRRSDDLVYLFQRIGPEEYKRTDGDYRIIRHKTFAWIAWDEETQTVMGRPWNILPADQGNAPPEGEWVSKKGDKSYVYDLVYVAPN